MSLVEVPVFPMMIRRMYLKQDHLHRGVDLPNARLLLHETARLNDHLAKFFVSVFYASCTVHENFYEGYH